VAVHPTIRKRIRSAPLALVGALALLLVVCGHSPPPASAAPTAKGLARALDDLDKATKKVRDKKPPHTDDLADLENLKQGLFDKYFGEIDVRGAKLNRIFKFFDCADSALAGARARSHRNYGKGEVAEAIEAAKRCLESGRDEIVNGGNPQNGQLETLKDLIESFEKTAKRVADGDLKVEQNDKAKNDKAKGKELEKKLESLEEHKLSFINAYYDKTTYRLPFPEIFKPLDAYDKKLAKARVDLQTDHADSAVEALQGAHLDVDRLREKLDKANQATDVFVTWAIGELERRVCVYVAGPRGERGRVKLDGAGVTSQNPMATKIGDDGSDFSSFTVTGDGAFKATYEKLNDDGSYTAAGVATETVPASQPRQGPKPPDKFGSTGCTAR
jgi:hypothetical protein